MTGFYKDVRSQSQHGLLVAPSEGSSHTWAQRSLSVPPQFGAGDGPMPAQRRRNLGLHCIFMEWNWQHLSPGIT